jgi:hypothetical protein
MLMERDLSWHSNGRPILMGLTPQPIGEQRVEQSSLDQVTARRPRPLRPKPLTERFEARKTQPWAALVDRVLRSDRARIDRFVSWTVFLGSLVFILLKAPGLDYFLTSRDHGYQLSIGTQVLMGKVPGIDVIITYGPMAMYTSAIGLWASDSLIGETILCAAGYSLCLLLIYRLVAAYSSRTAGLVAAGFGLLLLSRFYKWYVWLIPLATLWVLHRYLSSPAQRRWRWVVSSGFVLGLGWLYRLDMGTLGLSASIAFFCWLEACHPSRNIVRALRTVVVLLAAFSVLPLAWFGYLAIKLGPDAPFDFVRKTITAASGIVSGMSQPLPSDPIVILAYVLVPATLLLGAGISLCRERVGRADPRSRFLLAVALVGLSVLHQAMHRKGPVHLLQVLSPSLICAFVISAVFKQRFIESSLSKTRKWAYGSVGVVYFLLLVVVGVGLSQWGRQDLVELSFWPAHRYLDLARPLAAPDRFPAVKMVQTIREQTRSTDSILVFPVDCQLYAIAGRRMSGRLSAYLEGFFDDPRYHSENLAAIFKEMPKLVVLPSDRKTPSPGDVWVELQKKGRRAHHYVERFVRERYRQVIYDDGESMVLGREGLSPSLIVDLEAAR